MVEVPDPNADPTFKLIPVAFGSESSFMYTFFPTHYTIDHVLFENGTLFREK